MYLCGENKKIIGMKRTIYSSLLAWKEQSDRKPLIPLYAVSPFIDYAKTESLTDII